MSTPLDEADLPTPQQMAARHIEIGTALRAAALDLKPAIRRWKQATKLFKLAHAEALLEAKAGNPDRTIPEIEAIALGKCADLYKEMMDAEGDKQGARSVYDAVLAELSSWQSLVGMVKDEMRLAR